MLEPAKEYIKAASRKSYLKNKVLVLERSRLWAQKNHDRTREIAKKHSRSPKGRYKAAQNIAARRGRTFNISFVDYENIISHPCYYCNDLLGQAKTGIGLDRINNSEGYEVSNVVSCCGTCNLIKHKNFSREETLCMVQALLDFRKRKVG